MVSTKLKELLDELVKVPGVVVAVVVSRDGFILESAAAAGSDPEAVGAIIASGIGSVEAMGRELDLGAFHQSLVEYGSGVILMSQITSEAVLAITAQAGTGLGMVRYHAKRVIPMLAAAL
jgi:predicted regulator of Ras-like GTPase activity (Roadblock/LC7/MglB family)